MNTQDYVKLLKKEVKGWNEWREQHADVAVNLAGANLSESKLSAANLKGVELRKTKLWKVDLWGADLRDTDLSEADLRSADLIEVNLQGANLSGADLSIANLRGADLRGASLRGADLRDADLRDADLRGANLWGADLSRANLRGVNGEGADLRETILRDALMIGARLQGADLREADLIETNFRDASLEAANLEGAIFYETILANSKLSGARGLEHTRHRGPSNVDRRTLAASGRLAVPFLQGCGLTDLEIEMTHLYQPGLTANQVTDVIYRIFELYAPDPIQYRSCFLRHHQADEVFVRTLYYSLQEKGVRSWFVPDDLKAGDELHHSLYENIHFHERMLLILSAASLESDWLESEIHTALEKEKKEQRQVLYPIRLDDSMLLHEPAWLPLLHGRDIMDFSVWQDEAGYRGAFAQLIKRLREG